MSWPTASLGDITTKIGSGSTPAGGERAYKRTGIPLIRSMNVYDGEFVEQGLAYLDERQAAALNHVTLQSGDVLLNITGASVARVCKLPDQFSGGRVNQHVSIVRPDSSRLDSGFVTHLLRAPEAKARLLRVAGAGATREAITKAQIEEFRIPLPPLDEQRRIAAILDQADALGRKRKRALKLLDDLSWSIFVQMFGDMADQGEVRYPLISFAELVSSQKIGLVRAASELTENAPVPYLRMDAISLDGGLDLQDVKRTTASKAEISEYELKPGDFLFNTRSSRELVGKAAVFDGPDGFIYNNNILRVRFTKKIKPEYASAFFRTRLAKNELEVRKSGTTSVFAIYQRNLDTMPIGVPPIDDQQRFADCISKIAKLKAYLGAVKVRSGQLFSSLQHRAFSGQL